MINGLFYDLIFVVLCVLFAGVDPEIDMNLNLFVWQKDLLEQLTALIPPKLYLILFFILGLDPRFVDNFNYSWEKGEGTEEGSCGCI